MSMTAGLLALAWFLVDASDYGLTRGSRVTLNCDMASGSRGDRCRWDCYDLCLLPVTGKPSEELVNINGEDLAKCVTAIQPGCNLVGNVTSVLATSSLCLLPNIGNVTNWFHYTATVPAADKVVVGVSDYEPNGVLLRLHSDSVFETCLEKATFHGAFATLDGPTSDIAGATAGSAAFASSGVLPKHIAKIMDCDATAQTLQALLYPASVDEEALGDPFVSIIGYRELSSRTGFGYVDLNVTATFETNVPLRRALGARNMRVVLAANSPICGRDGLSMSDAAEIVHTGSFSLPTSASQLFQLNLVTALVLILTLAM